MNKNKELISNTFIIFIGKFCTQFINFLLVPIYTHYLIASDYGYVDLIQSYISLLAPIIILRFDSAIFRFLIDYRNNKLEQEKVISSSFNLMLIQIIIFIILFLIVGVFWKIKYFYLVLLSIVSISISSYLLQLTRGIGRNVDYSIGSIISAILTIGINLLMIIKFQFNASSILYSSIIANLICSTFLILKNKLYKTIKIKKCNFTTIKNMLKYSLPMIPDGLSWWVVNVSDRTIISILINTTANGIYAISSKFSNILSNLFQVFNMSWQESASLHINDLDKEDFFSDILNKSYMIFFSICILLQSAMPIIFSLFIGKSYMDAYNYVPILLLGNLFNAVANVIGGIYIAKKDTRSVAKTTLMSALINILINILLIKKYRLYAAAISTLISYIVVATYRYFDIKKTIDVKFNFNKFVISILIYAFSLVLYYINNTIINLLNILMVLILVFKINRPFILNLFNRNKVVKKMKKIE